jgi:hypothetical protein
MERITIIKCSSPSTECAYLKTIYYVDGKNEIKTLRICAEAIVSGALFNCDKAIEACALFVDGTKEEIIGEH